MSPTTKSTVAMATTTTKIRITVEKKTEKNTAVGNTDFKIDVEPTIKRTEIVKCTCFHLIPYIHSPVMRLSIATNNKINSSNGNNDNKDKNNGRKKTEKNTAVGNTDFKIDVEPTIKRTEIVKCTCFHLIPYIHSPVMRLSIATMTTFLGTSFIFRKTNWVEEARKISFSAMPSPNIPGLTFLLNKTFPSPTVE